MFQHKKQAKETKMNITKTAWPIHFQLPIGCGENGMSYSGKIQKKKIVIFAKAVIGKAVVNTIYEADAI